MTPHGLNAYSLVTFRNSQGDKARGTLLKLTQSSVVFEVYNPYAVVQLSEVLNEFTLRRNDRIIYQGRAVVSNRINTGLVIVCSVTLVDSWQEPSNLTAEPNNIEIAALDFIKNFAESHNILADYQLVVGDLRTFLSELCHWLTQIDVLRDNNATLPSIDDACFTNISGPI